MSKNKGNRQPHQKDSNVNTEDQKQAAVIGTRDNTEQSSDTSTENTQFQNDAAVTGQPAEEQSGEKPVAQEDAAPIVLEEEEAAPALVNEIHTPESDTAAVQDRVLALGLSSSGSVMALQEMDAYVTAMVGDNILSPDQGAAHQAGLFRALMGAITAADEDFAVVMTDVLRLFQENKDGCLSALHAFRFMSHMRLRSPADIAAFKALVNMFMVMADPKGRGLASKQVNFEVTLTHPKINEQHRQRVMAYFNVK